MKIKLLLIILIFLSLFSLLLTAQSDPPGGNYRIAYSADGNQHDKDDWHASVLALALLAENDLKERLVHFDYNSHLGDNNPDMEAIHKGNVMGAVQRYGYDPSVFFNDQADIDASLASIAAAINASSADNPLFLISAGPMEVSYRGLAAADPDKRQYVNMVSHSNWNDNHSDTDQLNHTWNDIISDFPVNNYHISDQNSTAFRSTPLEWEWLKLENHGEWLYEAVATMEKAGDASDAGMIYYVITGAQELGQYARMEDIQRVMHGDLVLPDDRPNPNPNPFTMNRDYQDENGLIIMEPENTWSPLGLWITKTDVSGYTGDGHIEFTGNNPASGPPTSPLQYVFRVREGGLYQLIMRARKRLEDAPDDNCNDAYVRLDGDYEASPYAGNNHNDDSPMAALRVNTKMFGGSPNGWGWAQKLDLGGNSNKRYPKYVLKAGETYTLTISGRSQRFNIDRIIFFNTDIYTPEQAKATMDIIETKARTVSNLSAELILPATISLNWEDGSDQETQFAVMRSADHGDFEEIALLPADSTDYLEEVPGGHTYTYLIEARNDSGAIGESNEVDVRAPIIITEYKNAELNVTNNHIKPHLKILNLNDNEIPYSNIKIRYWFTSENHNTLQFHVDHAQIGNANVQGNFVLLDRPCVGANAYLEISFTEAAGSIAPASDSGQIEIRFNKLNWSNFDELNDHSYGENGNYIIWDKVTIYLNGNLKFGSEPALLPLPNYELRVLSEKPDHDPISDNHIRENIEIVNNGSLPIPFENLKLRYWFTSEGDSPLNFFVDYALMGKNNIVGNFIKPTDYAYDNADTYLEISFPASAGVFPASSNTGLMQTRWSKSDWSNFDESDDYSLEMSTDMIDNMHFTAYIGDDLVWGEEPVAYTIIPARIEAEDYFNFNKVAIEPTHDVDGGYHIWKIKNGFWSEYRIHVPEDGIYTVRARVSTNQQGGFINFRINGVTTGIVEVEDEKSDSWRDWYTAENTVDLPAGNHTLRLLYTSPYSGKQMFLNWFEFIKQ